MVGVTRSVVVVVVIAYGPCATAHFVTVCVLVRVGAEGRCVVTSVMLRHEMSCSR